MAAEVPAGAIDGMNTVFTAAAALTSTHLLFADRFNQTPSTDYTYSGNTITFLPAAFPTSTVPGAPPVGTKLSLWNG